MPTFVTRDHRGIIVKEGTEVQNFRGEKRIFTRALRAREEGRSGKVMVGGQEFYDHVWGLTVRTKMEDEARQAQLREGATAVVEAMSAAAKPKREWWTLVHPDGDLVVPMDDAPGARNDGGLLYYSEHDATRAAEHQNRMYQLNCRPVRVSEVQ